MSRFGRLGVLIRKEFERVLRDRTLVAFLIVPPALQLLIFGYALRPQAEYIPLGVVDEMKTGRSRDLVSAFTQSRAFALHGSYADAGGLADGVRRGDVSAGLVIPPTYERDLQQGRARVQVLVDGVNSYNAGLAQGYAALILANYDRTLAPAPAGGAPTNVISFAYNPGLISAWFFVPGVIGTLLMIVGSLASAVNAIREKAEGTLEQLLMTPAAAWEVTLSKIVPLSILFLGVLVLVLTVARLAFALPMRGSLPLYFAIAAVYIVGGVSLGLLLSTLARTRVQAILMGLFINLPLMMLSGALAPVESMPPFWQAVSLFDPLRHFAQVTRGLLIRGAGLDVLWPNVLALAAFSALLIVVSSARYRSQLS
jgi:ABC-2 type transport system permease protein